MAPPPKPVDPRNDPGSPYYVGSSYGQDIDPSTLKTDPNDVWGNLNNTIQGWNDAMFAPGTQAADEYKLAQYPTKIENADFYQANAQKLANADPRQNPYNSTYANQSRGAMSSLYDQMMAQAQGPSIAGMQAQGAYGSTLASALAGGPNGAGIAQRAGATVQGIGTDAAGVGAQQQMSQLAGAGAFNSGMRGADIQSAQQQMQGALGVRALDNAQRAYYAQQGSSINNAQMNAKLEDYKFKKKLYQDYLTRARAARDNTIQTTGTIIGMAAKGG